MHNLATFFFLETKKSMYKTITIFEGNSAYTKKHTKLQCPVRNGEHTYLVKNMETSVKMVGKNSKMTEDRLPKTFYKQELMFSNQNLPRRLRLRKYME